MAGSFRSKWPLRLSVGLVAGAIIAAVDNVLFEGEVSPIVVVGMLLMASITAGASWGWRGWVAAVAAWAWVPAAHVVKQVLGLPDTLHPNTYASIGKLAVFSFAVTAVSTVCGLFVHRFAVGAAKPAAPGTSINECPDELTAARTADGGR